MRRDELVSALLSRWCADCTVTLEEAADELGLALSAVAALVAGDVDGWCPESLIVWYEIWSPIITPATRDVPPELRGRR